MCKSPVHTIVHSISKWAAEQIHDSEHGQRQQRVVCETYNFGGKDFATVADFIGYMGLRMRG